MVIKLFKESKKGYVMHSHYIEEMEEAVDAIIQRDSLSKFWSNRAHIIIVAKETDDLNILNDIFDAFIKYEETVDVGIYSALHNNSYIDKHLKEELDGCNAKLHQPTLDELDDMEMHVQ